ncbi:enoyl-CoA hydratase/isomerase family protein [Amycolatopsis nivea]
MTVDGPVRYESDDGIAVITLERPGKLNAINQAAAAALEQAWHRFDEGPDSVAVLTGAAGAFTAGVDVTDPPQDSAWAPNLGVTTTKPIVLAVDGWCIGAGMILLQQADLCVATRSSRFRYPEARLGLSRGMATGLAAKIPHKIAMEILLLGRVTTAEELYRAGLVNAIAEEGGALATAREWAAEIAAADQDVVRYLKEGVLATLPRGPGEAAEQARSRAARLPGNQRLLAGKLTAADLKENR